MYGSSFCIVTRRPRLFRSRPRDEAVRPLPSELATPPVTKMCFATGTHPTSAQAGVRGRQTAQADSAQLLHVAVAHGEDGLGAERIDCDGCCVLRYPGQAPARAP